MRRSVDFVVVLVVFVAAVPCWAGRWYEDYEQAVILIEGGGCSREALELLGAAVVDKPRPRLNARTIAVQSIDYLPYYQLARAHLACGDIESSRHYLEISRSRGVAPSDFLDQLERQLTDLEAQSEREPEPNIDPSLLAARVREVNETIRRARLLATQIEASRGNIRFVGLFETNSALLNRATEDLDRAEESLADGTLRRDMTAIDAAFSSASAAMEAFTSIVDRIEAVKQIPPTATPTPIRPSQPTRTPTTPLPSPTATVPLPVTESPRPVFTPRVVPLSLRRAATDYLQGSYRDVVDLLEPETLPLEREQAAAHLLRSAANYALYCLSARKDEERLERASRDLAACRSIDASVQPDPRFFSPDFLTFSRSNGALDEISSEVSR